MASEFISGWLQVLVEREWYYALGPLKTISRSSQKTGENVGVGSHGNQDDIVLKREWLLWSTASERSSESGIRVFII